VEARRKAVSAETGQGARLAARPGRIRGRGFLPEPIRQWHGAAGAREMRERKERKQEYVPKNTREVISWSCSGLRKRNMKMVAESSISALRRYTVRQSEKADRTTNECLTERGYLRAQSI
jgi:hypothetical protein